MPGVDPDADDATALASGGQCREVELGEFIRSKRGGRVHTPDEKAQTVIGEHLVKGQDEVDCWMLADLQVRSDKDVAA